MFSYAVDEVNLNWLSESLTKASPHDICAGQDLRLSELIKLDNSRVSNQNRKMFLFAVSFDFHTDWPLIWSKQLLIIIEMLLVFDITTVLIRVNIRKVVTWPKSHNSFTGRAITLEDVEVIFKVRNITIMPVRLPWTCLS